MKYLKHINELNLNSFRKKKTDPQVDPQEIKEIFYDVTDMGMDVNIDQQLYPNSRRLIKIDNHTNLITDKIKINQIEESILRLMDYLKERGVDKIKIWVKERGGIGVNSPRDLHVTLSKPETLVDRFKQINSIFRISIYY